MDLARIKMFLLCSMETHGENLKLGEPPFANHHGSILRGTWPLCVTGGKAGLVIAALHPICM
jgi:hypothetical protein